MPGRYDITVLQGSTYTLPITVWYVDRTPYNLTDCVVRGQIRRTHKSTIVIANFVCTITDASNGKVTISLTDTITEAIPAGETISDPRSRYVYDIEIENTITGVVTRLLEGVVLVSPEVTR